MTQLFLSKTSDPCLVRDVERVLMRTETMQSKPQAGRGSNRGFALSLVVGRAGRLGLTVASVLGLLLQAHGQGTLQITFDGPPVPLPGTSAAVQAYGESGVWFLPIPGSISFGRRGSNPRDGWPDNGSAYVQAGLGDSLMFGLDAGSSFRLLSVDLAEFSTLYAEPVMVRFTGYFADGSSVTTDLVTDGIIDGTGPLADFQTFYFGPEFSNLMRVEIPTFGWSLDNLVIAIPEPGTGALVIFGGALLGFRFIKRRRRLS